jgi:16S rRNA (cytidine1402-2'-O)-methyltransferase
MLFGDNSYPRDEISSEGTDVADDLDFDANRIRATVARAADELSVALAKPIAPGLYLVATPIGNLADITLRALAVLAQADTVYCEDTRHSRTLMERYALTSTLKPYHEHNAETERPRILRALESGKRIALISDAGTPLISDPGFKLVRDAAAVGVPVVSIPGASAVLAALTSSGLPTDTFLFAGFLPAKDAARRVRLEELASVPASLIFFEAPQRLAETLSTMADVLGARPAAVAREVTKLHEEFRRAPLAELAQTYASQAVKGEVAIVVAPPLEVAISDQDIAEKLRLALQSMTLKDAAKAVADRLGVPKARVYDIGLALKSAREEPAR